ncbi:Hypothetical_protein [Hexamita inflata]|uniref:Hypothetical_protein n=1 Tax=Hexamita inflata TaxID=28002 RepID=A0AA86P0H9_9EUKA|nr:Hypothetical protein HINF_LOCUS17001 [Hexamita inflata]
MFCVFLLFGSEQKVKLNIFKHYSIIELGFVHNYQYESVYFLSVTDSLLAVFSIPNISNTANLTAKNVQYPENFDQATYAIQKALFVLIQDEIFELEIIIKEEILSPEEILKRQKMILCSTFGGIIGIISIIIILSLIILQHKKRINQREDVNQIENKSGMIFKESNYSVAPTPRNSSYSSSKKNLQGNEEKCKTIVKSKLGPKKQIYRQKDKTKEEIEQDQKVLQAIQERMRQINSKLKQFKIVNQSKQQYEIIDLSEVPQLETVALQNIVEKQQHEQQLFEFLSNDGFQNVIIPSNNKQTIEIQQQKLSQYKEQEVDKAALMSIYKKIGLTFIDL